MGIFPWSDWPLKQVPNVVNHFSYFEFLGLVIGKYGSNILVFCIFQTYIIKSMFADNHLQFATNSLVKVKSKHRKYEVNPSMFI